MLLLTNFPPSFLLPFYSCSLSQNPISEVAGEGKHYGKFFQKVFPAVGITVYLDKVEGALSWRDLYSPSCQAPKSTVGAHGWSLAHSYQIAVFLLWITSQILKYVLLMESCLIEVVMNYSGNDFIFYLWNALPVLSVYI